MLTILYFENSKGSATDFSDTYLSSSADSYSNFFFNNENQN